MIEDGGEGPARVTMRQVAQRAGVSEAAASYALNGRRGVSAETRARVQAAAHELGWAPNSAARSLVAARAHAVGLAVVRPPRTMTIDSYFTQLLSGVEAELNRNARALVLHLVDTIDDTVAVYRRWWAGRHVDAVILTDLRLDDPRPAALAELGLPAAVIGGGPEAAAAGFSTIDIDVPTITADIVGYLHALGHRRIARVAGDGALLHTRHRDAGFAAAFDRAGIDPAHRVVIYTDYGAAAGMRAMRRLMSAPDRPTAVVFDNDVMAAAALRVATEMGLSVPADVSLVAWDDSDLCEIVVPSLTAVQQTPAAQAERAAAAVVAMEETGTTRHEILPAGTLVARQSTRPLRPDRPAV